MIKGSSKITMFIDKFKGNTFDEIDKALMQVGYKVIEDVEYGQNAVSVPIDEGTLLGSSHVAVLGHKGKKENWYSTGQKAKTEVQPMLDGMQMESARISYNTEYAEGIHEGYNQMIPGEGSQQKFGIPAKKQERYGYKFLERTLMQNRQEYYELFAELLRDGIKRA